MKGIVKQGSEEGDLDVLPLIILTMSRKGIRGLAYLVQEAEEDGLEDDLELHLEEAPQRHPQTPHQRQRLAQHLRIHEGERSAMDLGGMCDRADYHAWVPHKAMVPLRELDHTTRMWSYSLFEASPRRCTRPWSS